MRYTYVLLLVAGGETGQTMCKNTTWLTGGGDRKHRDDEHPFAYAAREHVEPQITSLLSIFRSSTSTDRARLALLVRRHLNPRAPKAG